MITNLLFPKHCLVVWTEDHVNNILDIKTYKKPILVYITHWIEKNLERVVERIMKVFTFEGKLVINGSYLCKFKEGQSPLGVP